VFWDSLREIVKSMRDIEGEHARFGFGANWKGFIALVDETCIESAERSLCEMLGVNDLAGRRFLDIGSGSGLFSLAARRLGARVHSFDYDRQSVACTAELRRRFFPDDTAWAVEQGSALDAAYLTSLGEFDVVYSWGVLHHTGAMWCGIENALSRVRPGGTLFIAIYNDQGLKSHIWWVLKWVYNQLPRPLNVGYAYALGFGVNLLNILRYTFALRPMAAIRPLLHYRSRRGMSVTHDMVDWVGGMPYEFARYDMLLSYLEARGCTVINGRPNTSLGCHELVLRR
jgi:SAM-dependent methyltransferase